MKLPDGDIGRYLSKATRNYLAGAFIWLALTTSSSLLAEASAANAINIDFSVLKIGNAPLEGIRVQADASTVAEPRLRRLQRSKSITYHGPNPIVFFREAPAPTSQDPNALERIPLAQYPVPKGQREALLFFHIGQDDALSITGMDDSLSAFPRNSLVVFNATGAAMIARIGDENVRIAPGPNEAVSYEAFIDDHLPVGFAVEMQDGPKITFENQLEMRADERVILVLSPPRRVGSQRLSVYAVTESLGEKVP